MPSRKLIVEIVGDSRSLERALGRSARSAEGFGRSFTRSVAGIGAALAGGAGLTLAVRAVVNEMAEAQKVAAQTGAVLRSTGGIAGVTAGDVDELAQSLMNLSGVDDEVIAQGENLLLTFTNVRNVVGEGNDIFDQATRAALDMSVALGTDLQSSVIRVGKALQDPIRGFTALRRAGVNLSVQQQKQIRTLVEHGRVLEAQKILLRELQTEFGGVAEAVGNTLPAKVNIFRENLLNLGQVIVSELEPQLTELIDRAVKWIQNTENQKRVIDAFREVGRVIEQIVGFIQKVVDAVDNLGDRYRLTQNEMRQDTLRFGLTLVEVFSHLPGQAGDWARDFKQNWRVQLLELQDQAAGIGKDTGDAYGLSFASAASEHLDIIRRQLEAAPEAARRGGAAPPGGGGGGGGGMSAAEQRQRANQWFDAMLGRELDKAQDLSLQQQIRRFRQIAAMIQERINITRDITRKLNLEAQLRQVNRQIRAAMEQAESDAAADREEQREKRRLARERELARLRAQQFAILGQGPLGGEIIPNAASLRKRFQDLAKVIPGTELDTDETRGRLAQLRRLFAKNWKSMSSDVKSFVDNILDEWGRLLEEQNESATRFRWRGGTPPGQSTAFTGRPGAIVINGPMTFNGIQNVRQLEAEIARRSRSRPKTRRGAG